jgi:hypothetical protein
MAFGMIGMLFAKVRRVRICVTTIVAAFYALGILGPALAILAAERGKRQSVFSSWSV